MSKYIQCGQKGIYFLLLDSQVVYVGSTTDFPRRITAHYDKIFNRIRFIPCDDAKKQERRWMRLFKPKYNTQTFTREWRDYLIDTNKFQPESSRFLDY